MDNSREYVLTDYYGYFSGTSYFGNHGGSVLGISLPYCNKNGKSSMAAVLAIVYKRILLT